MRDPLDDGEASRRAAPPTLPAGAAIKRLAWAVFDYLVGFIALAVFGAYAFAGPPSDQRWVAAFKLGAALAVMELLYLWWRSLPANRLILGANLWLLAGGLAAATQQWWLLLGYQRWGEASLFVAMLVVGLAATLGSRAGFVGAAGPPHKVRRASLALLAAVAGALATAVAFRGDAKLAAVLPVIGLSWLNRALRLYVQRDG